MTSYITTDLTISVEEHHHLVFPILQHLHTQGLRNLFYSRDSETGKLIVYSDPAFGQANPDYQTAFADAKCKVEKIENFAFLPWRNPPIAFSDLVKTQLKALFVKVNNPDGNLAIERLENIERASAKTKTIDNFGFGTDDFGDTSFENAENTKKSQTATEAKLVELFNQVSKNDPQSFSLSEVLTVISSPNTVNSQDVEDGELPSVRLQFNVNGKSGYQPIIPFKEIEKDIEIIVKRMSKILGGKPGYRIEFQYKWDNVSSFSIRFDNLTISKDSITHFKENIKRCLYAANVEDNYTFTAMAIANKPSAEQRHTQSTQERDSLIQNWKTHRDNPRVKFQFFSDVTSAKQKQAELSEQGISSTVAYGEKDKQKVFLTVNLGQ